MSYKEILVGLDIGTSKVLALAAEITPEGDLKIVGVGRSRSVGLKKGVVINLDATMKAIEEAVEEAERMADIEIESVTLNITGNHLQSMNSRKVVAIGGQNKEIVRDDMERLQEEARIFSLNPGREIVNTVTREYTVDDQAGIRNPLGMSGLRLESEVHVITAASANVQNIIKCVERVGLISDNLVTSSLAAATAALTDDEKELGVVLIDLGAGTTDIAIFTGGSVVYSAVIPVGGDNVTNDLAIGLRTPADEAERIKVNYGSCLASTVDAEEKIEVPNAGGEEVRLYGRKAICEIIGPRMEELFELIKGQLDKSGCSESIPAGIVLTGGGSCLAGIQLMAESMLGLPTRIGYPMGVQGLAEKVKNPSCSVAWGLLKWSLTRYKDNAVPAPIAGIWRPLFSRIKALISDFF